MEMLTLYCLSLGTILSSLVTQLHSVALPYHDAVVVEASEVQVKRTDFDAVHCTLKPDSGNQFCRAAIPSFYYNPAEKQCLSFTWNGCGGNNNRFASLEECKESCSEDSERPVTKSASSNSSETSVTVKQTATPLQDLKASSSSQTTAELVGIRTGGGSGSSVKPPSSPAEATKAPSTDAASPHSDEKRETSSSVVVSKSTSTSSSATSSSAGAGAAVCNLQAHTSTGNSSSPLTASSSSSPTSTSQSTTSTEGKQCAKELKCDRGCSLVSGNDGCVSCRCVSDADQDSNPCQLPVQKGICRAFLPRWRFNSTSGKCETFMYGGCGGNGNNFESEEECEKKCKKSITNESEKDKNKADIAKPQ